MNHSNRREGMNQVASARSDQEIVDTIRELRRQVAGMLASIDELQRRVVPGDGAAAATPPSIPCVENAEPVRTEVIIHNITSPALARTAQQHLVQQASVHQARVRELAEGTLRITVESERGIDVSTLEDWEPARHRTSRTETAHVLELEMGPPVDAAP